MSDPIEVKVNVDGDVAAALSVLGTAASAETVRDIWFAEARSGLAGGHGELVLLSHRIAIRVRSGADGDDLTVKLRPCERADLSGEWMSSFEDAELQYKIEGDWCGERHVLAASAIRDGVGGSLRAITEPDADVATALNTSQRRFLVTCGPPEVVVDDLIALGPISSTKWTEVEVGGLDLNVERWVTEDLDLLELSIRVKPKKHESDRDFLARLSAEQHRLESAVVALGLPIADGVTKTQQVLSALASRLPIGGQ